MGSDLPKRVLSFYRKDSEFIYEVENCILKKKNRNVMNICMYVDMYVCMYACMHACMYV